MRMSERKGEQTRGTNDGTHAASAQRSGGERSSVSAVRVGGGVAKKPCLDRTSLFRGKVDSKKQSERREYGGHAEEGDASARDARLVETHETATHETGLRLSSSGAAGAAEVGRVEVIGAGRLGGGVEVEEEVVEPSELTRAMKRSQSGRQKNSAQSARARKASEKPQPPVKRRLGASAHVANIGEKRRKRLGVTTETANKAQERYRHSRKEAGAPRGGKALQLPSDEEHAAHGLQAPYTAVSVLRFVKEFYQKSYVVTNAQTFMVYSTYLRKYLVWCYRDWISTPAGRPHPYQCGSVRFTRFVQECFCRNSHPDDDEMGYDAEVSKYADIQFGVGGLKPCCNALTLLWKAVRHYDELLHKEWSAPADALDLPADARAAQAKLADPDDAYAFSARKDRDSLTVYKLGCWTCEKQKSTALERSLASGGRPRGGFSNTAAVLAPIENDENNDFTFWLADSQRDNPSSYLTVHSVVGCARAVEHFLARPSDVLELKYAVMSLMRVERVQNAVVPVPHVVLTIHRHKGSTATAKSELKIAIRHSDVTQCGISALFEMMWANFTLAGFKPPDLSERDDSHVRANLYPSAVDADAMLQATPRKMIKWHGRHVISRDRMTSADIEANEKNDYVPVELNFINSLLHKIREAVYVEKFTQSDNPPSSTYEHAMHRRSSSGNKMLIRGCSVQCIEHLAGWVDVDTVSRQHYLHVPPPQALIAAAGCNVTSAYYLEFRRETLPVSNELRRHAFPFIEELREARDMFNREGWPAKLADKKIDGFIEVLEYASVVLWQDWAVTRALEELDEQRQAVEERNASEGDGWNFWEQDFFVDAGEDWQALCDEARKRVSNPDAKIPEHVQDTHPAQVLAVAKQTLDMQKVCSEDVRRVDDNVKDLRELIDAKFATLASTLQEKISALASRAQPASSAWVRATREATQRAEPAQPTEREITVGKLEKMGKGCTREAFKDDVVAALQSWKDLEETFTLPTLDSDSRKYLQRKCFAFGEWFRVLERFSEDNARGVYGNAVSQRNRQNDALRGLQKRRLKSTTKASPESTMSS